jgi:hypothetical protein
MVVLSITSTYQPKNKWGFLFGDYKKKHDYMSGTKHNEKYWDMYVEEKITQGLPKNFKKMFIEFIDSFMSSTPCFNPPHMRNFIN